MQKAQEVIDAINTDVERDYSVEYLIERGNAEIRRSLESAKKTAEANKIKTAVLAKIKESGKSMEEILESLA